MTVCAKWAPTRNPGKDDAMLRGIYNVAYAMEVATRNHEIVAENLVNSTTPGYRRQGLVYEASASAAANAGYSATAGAAPAPSVPGGISTYLHLESGTLQQTANPLDFAIDGTAFFVVQGPNGPLYTRNGAFELGPGGELRTRGGGYAVNGDSGAITVPPDTSAITVATDGSVTANGNPVGHLRLANFANPQTLRRVGSTLFEGDAPETPPPNTVRIDQGYREGSNVEPVQEMVSMMLGMRFYEAAGKAMQAISDAIAQNTRPS
jgi:flagellar basal-body rod protein FlgF